MTRHELIQRSPWNPYTVTILNKHRVNLQSLVMLVGSFLATFLAYYWANYGHTFNLSVGIWVIPLIYLVSFGLLNGCLASVHGTWAWTRWMRCVMLSTVRTLPWVTVALITSAGVVAPVKFPREVFDHGGLRAIVWIGLGYSVDLWLFGVVTRWWTLNNSVQQSHEGTFHRGATTWIAGTLTALLIGGPAWRYVHSPMDSATVLGTFLFWLLFLWIPIAGRLGWALAYAVDKQWTRRTRRSTNRQVNK